MPIYFQKISNRKFDPDGSFDVKDSRGCNLTIGCLMLAAFACILLVDHFDLKHPSIYQLLYLSVVPAVYMIRRGVINKTIITINRHGFYYLGAMVTNWDNFIDAVIRQDEENKTPPFDLADRFVLVIRYGKIGQPGYFIRKFLLTAAMDKSEEEIMAAMKFYFAHRDPGMILPYMPGGTSAPEYLLLPGSRSAPQE